ncbi:MAG: hypothetical protein V2J07_04045 [Anaerolineae bacterium]|jgi:hypothetical protein|nr:hypothetical protein [Anaerolineae bacterium]
MKQEKINTRKPLKLILGFLLVVIIAVFGILVYLYIGNQNLPTASTVIDHLSEADKARLEEFDHLLNTFGDEVWPGWNSSTIPVIVYNEETVFLVNYPGEPPAGWQKMPSGEQRGSAWQVVLDDTIHGQPYYRQKLDPLKTPENFTVKVGSIWVATMQTYEYAAIEFYSQFGNDLPGVLRAIFPYQFFWKLLIPNSETYVAGIAHESFHAYQGTVSLDRMAEAEKMISVESGYPWNDEQVRQMWQEELDLLYQAVQEEDLEVKRELAAQFLAQRVARRTQTSLSLEEIEFERQREWLEGLAKYAELSILYAAAADSAYLPVLNSSVDGEFDGYQKSVPYFERQLSEVTRMVNQDGEIRFYYTGMCMGLLLDDLLPGWKSEILTGKATQEQLLKEAVQ